MDEQYLLATVRYVELNPVKARLCENPEDWHWPSAGAHLLGRDDRVVSVGPMFNRISDWREYLSPKSVEEELSAIRQFSSSGSPLVVMHLSMNWKKSQAGRCAKRSLAPNQELSKLSPELLF